MAEHRDNRAPQGMPGFTTSRHPGGRHASRQYSGEKRAPWSIRANCRCHQVIPPGEPHVLIQEPGPGGTLATAVVCAAAAAAARAAEPEDQGLSPEGRP